MKPEEVSIYSDSIKQRGEGVAEIIFEVSDIQNEIDVLNAKGTQILIASDIDKMATIQSGLKGNILTDLFKSDSMELTSFLAAIYIPFMS